MTDNSDALDRDKQWLTTVLNDVESNHEVDVNQIDRETQSFPLLIAVDVQNVVAVQTLLSHPDIDVNQHHTWQGDTALILAIKRRNQTIVDALLAHPLIDINQRNHRDGAFPLALAVEHRDIDLTNRLLQRAEIDVNQFNYDDTRVGRRNVFPLLSAVETSAVEIVDALLRHPMIDVNRETPDDRLFALMAAVTNVNTDLVTKLADAGADLQKVWPPLDKNALEACVSVLQGLAEQESGKYDTPEWRRFTAGRFDGSEQRRADSSRNIKSRTAAVTRVARTLIQYGATLQNGAVPDLPANDG